MEVITSGKCKIAFAYLINILKKVKRIDYSILMVALVMLMTGCSHEDDVLQEAQQKGLPVTADLAFTVTTSTNSATRMSSAIVQDEGQPYRGLTMRYCVPFDLGTRTKVAIDDTPQAFMVTTTGEKLISSRTYYYYDKCHLMTGVNAFLSYGCAPIASTNKAVNGSLKETFPLDMQPKDILFSLESISTKTVHNTATLLAAYLSTIANTTVDEKAWKDTENTKLKLIYMNFVNVVGTGENAEGEILPGSSINIYTYAQVLKTTLQDLNESTLSDDDKAMRTAIIAKIDAYNTSLNGFPASIGLPDGAAVVRWNGTNFVPQISNTTVADINGIDCFAYPAELYYYGNSRIRTSIVNSRKSSYTDRSWDLVLADYEFENGQVTTNTTAVAIKEPLQYAVARAQVRLLKTSEALADAKGIGVTVGTNNFPLTGIIIGGQMPVGYDFSPNTLYPVYSEADMKYIYDSQVKTNGLASNEYFYLSSASDAAMVTNTLVLQSYDHKKVPIVLEFQNNSDKDFQGFEGIVYRGTKFYLVGEIDPEVFKEDDRIAIRDRVFTQDYITMLNLKVKALDKAYNVVPNLLSPRLEIGIELVSEWVSTTPEEILF